MRLAALVALVLATAARAEVLEPGLELLVFDAPQKSFLGDSKIHVARIDPAKWRLRILTAGETGAPPMTAKEWAQTYGLRAVINAGMFHPGGQPVGHMKSRAHVGQPRIIKDRTVFAFDALDPALPPAQIIDRDCQDFDALRPKYAALLQSIRMVDCNRRNVWSQQKRRWSTAALGMDRKGRVLFIHARSPYSVHDFTDMLLALPLDLRNAMYLEGGPEATLYVKAGGMELERFGSFETAFSENDDNARAWPLPNVIGVAPR
jgi:uncharacterized protein YigE (DUF2233 family)